MKRVACHRWWFLLLPFAFVRPAQGQDAARAASPFSVEAARGAAILLGAETIARTHLPAGFAPPRLARHEHGCTAFGPGHRQEWALFADRLEYTLECRLTPPIRSWCVLEVPLSDGAVASVVHGTFERPPQTTTLRVQALGRSTTAPDEIRMVRFVTVCGSRASYALDTQPAGAMGDDPGDLSAPMRALVARRVSGGLELRAALPGGYPARLRLKFIFYAPPRPFRELHPYVLMNYRYAFEKAVRIDFTDVPAPVKKKKSGRWRTIATQPYSRDAGCGWLGDSGHLNARSAPPLEPPHGGSVGAHRPGRFRIDVPPGHYYLTLNAGDPDGALGPMSVRVNGAPRVEHWRLDPGRFDARLLWITSSRDHIEIEFQGIDGAPWRINGLTLSALGTLAEDFTLTRPWWHLPTPDPCARPR